MVNEMRFGGGDKVKLLRMERSRTKKKTLQRSSVGARQVNIWASADSEVHMKSNGNIQEGPRGTDAHGCAEGWIGRWGCWKEWHSTLN